MSGTVTVRDMWLLTDIPLFLSFLEPLWCSSPVSRDVLMCSSRDVLCSVNLCPTFMYPVNMMSCQVNRGVAIRANILCLCPSTGSGNGKPTTSWNTEDSVEETNVDRGAWYHLCGGTGPATIWPGGYLCPFSLWWSEIQKQGWIVFESLSLFSTTSFYHAPMHLFIHVPLKCLLLLLHIFFSSSLYLVLSRFSLPAGVCQWLTSTLAHWAMAEAAH